MGHFPGGPVVKNPLYNAGDGGSIPGQGTKNPRATGQLSPRATTTELTGPNQRAYVPQTTEPMNSGAQMPQLQSPHSLDPARHNYRRENLYATTRQKSTCHNEEAACHNEKILYASTNIPHAATKTQRSQK